MTDEFLLSMLRADLEQPSPTVNEYLRDLLGVAKERIAGKGIHIDENSMSDGGLIVMFAAYLYRKRKADNPKGVDKMPRMLRSAINDRLVAEKGKVTES